VMSESSTLRCETITTEAFPHVIAMGDFPVAV